MQANTNVEQILPIVEESRQETLDIDSMFDAFVKVDEKDSIAAWNLQAEVIFGWSRKEALGRLVSQWIVSAHLDTFHWACRQLLPGGGKSSRKIKAQMIALRRDGTELEIEAILFHLRSGNGSAVGIFVRPVDPQKAEAEARHHALIDQLGECYSEIDLRGRFTFINKAYCETFGLSPADREGVSYKTAYAPEIGKLFRETYNKVYRTGKPAKIEYSMRLHNGKQVFNEQSVSLMRDVQGIPIGFMAIIRDGLKREQNEMELRRAKQAAESASQIKGQFLANMSHEVRTPLNGVIGMIELLSYTNPTLEQQELLETAQGAAQNLLVVINDILDLTKIEAGKLELDRIGFNLQEAITEIICITLIQAKKKGLELSCEMAAQVPTMVTGDPVRLKQVLLNLLGNAVKFTQKGQIAVRVQPEALDKNTVTLRFSVRDSGVGIPIEKQQVIFEPFSQGDASTTRKFGGTGLGLAICSRIVELMGGKIWLESRIGEGSTFHFTTVLGVSACDRPDPMEEARMDDCRENCRDLKILLVEDNLLNQRLAERLLHKLGHQVIGADNGIEALNHLREQHFDLVLIDIQMPEMDGFSATAAIRALEDQDKAGVPIVAMTAHAMKGDRERCLESGMNDYISKPISGDALKAVIARVLGSRPLKT